MTYLACGPIELPTLNMKQFLEKIHPEIPTFKKQNILQLLLIEIVDRADVEPIDKIEVSFINHSKILKMVFL